jgi:ferredoxin
MLSDEYADWAEYCVPECPLCAIELAREQVDEEEGWPTTQEARAVGDEAMRRAHDAIGAANVQQRL